MNMRAKERRWRRSPSGVAEHLEGEGEDRRDDERTAQRALERPAAVGRPSQARNSPRVLVVVLACSTSTAMSPQGRVGAHDPLSAKLLSRKGRVVSETALGSAEAHETASPTTSRRPTVASRASAAGRRAAAPRGDHRGRLADAVALGARHRHRQGGGTSPATFYQYFENVEAAIRVLAEEMVAAADDLAGLVHGTGPTTRAGRRPHPERGLHRVLEANRAVFRWSTSPPRRAWRN